MIEYDCDDAARDLGKILRVVSRFQGIRVDRDRVTYSLDGVVVTLIVASSRPLAATAALGACPFCGSTKPFHIKPATEHLHEQRGCTDCNTWIDPARYK